MTSSLRFGRIRVVAVLAAAGSLCTAALAQAAPVTLDPQLADAPNLVANASFHNGVDGWSKHLYNANVTGNGANVHNSGYVGQDVPVRKGASYAFSVRAGANPGGSVLALALDSGTGVSYITQTVTGPTTVAKTFTATGPTVYIACQAAGNGGWCNNFSLVSAPNAATGSGSLNTGSAG
jgi:hypothetical protein